MISLPQPANADEAMDAPVARMGVQVGATVDANQTVAITAPVWAGDLSAKLGDTLEDVTFAWSFVSALSQAAQAGVKHLALAVDSADFPKERAAKIAFGHVHGHLLRAPLPEKVSFVFSNQADADFFSRVAQSRREWMGSPRKK